MVVALVQKTTTGVHAYGETSATPDEFLPRNFNQDFVERLTESGLPKISAPLNAHLQDAPKRVY